MAVTVKENVKPEMKQEDPKDILEKPPPKQEHHEREKMKLREQPKISEIN